MTEVLPFKHPTQEVRQNDSCQHHRQYTHSLIEPIKPKNVIIQLHRYLCRSITYPQYLSAGSFILREDESLRNQDACMSEYEFQRSILSTCVKLGLQNILRIPPCCHILGRIQLRINIKLAIASK